MFRLYIGKKTVTNSRLLKSQGYHLPIVMYDNKKIFTANFSVYSINMIIFVSIIVIQGTENALEYTIFFSKYAVE